MEAQRICLSLVYSAHVDQVCESLKAEKESALCSLKEELVHHHMQEMTDLKRMHQLELQTLKFQQPGNLTEIMKLKLCMKNSVLKSPNQTSTRICASSCPITCFYRIFQSIFSRNCLPSTCNLLLR